jgi:hypothetical protein
VSPIPARLVNELCALAGVNPNHVQQIVIDYARAEFTCLSQHHERPYMRADRADIQRNYVAVPIDWSDK